jgi:hypothetical protein
MRQGSARVPFTERGGRLRGVIDLATGGYPAFLFGGAVGRHLPVFHIHEVTPASLEPHLRHVAENGYRTLVADEIADFIRTGRLPAARSVALTFDDARASLWTVAAPLLRRYGLRAITFAIPGRMTDAAAVRPTLDTGSADPGRADDESATPFVTWAELKALQASGVIDVQAHSLTHIAQYCSAEPVGFVTPAFAREPMLNRPIVSTGGPPRFLAPSALGAPLHARRSRLSDGLRFLADPAIAARTVEHVAFHGGAAFFERPGWEQSLRAMLPASCGRFESADDQARAIERELVAGREELEARLRVPVRHLALPWGVSGRTTRGMLERAGYATAFADRMFHPRRVRAGDDPYWLMRLNSKFIPCLPGGGRRTFFSTV